MILKNGKRIDGCSDTVPIGSLNPFLGTTAPFGYLICQGQKVSKTTYPELYAICGTTFGPETTTEFTLPDLRGQTIAGYKEGDSLFGTLGGLIGEATHTLTINEMPSHNHMGYYYMYGNNNWTRTIDERYHVTSRFVSSGAAINGNSQDNVENGKLYYTSENTSTYPITKAFLFKTAPSESVGEGEAHNNIQPTITLNWIVKAIMLIPNQSTVVNTSSASTTNVYSSAYMNTLLDQMKREAFDFAHPVGSYYETSDSTWTPQAAGWYGTWIKEDDGATLVSYKSSGAFNKTPGTIVGAETASTTYTPTGTNTGTAVTLNAVELTHSGGAVQSHTLTAAESGLPAHNHPACIAVNYSTGGTNFFNFSPNGVTNTTPANGSIITKDNTAKSATSGHTHGFTQPSKHSFTPTTKTVTNPTFTGTQATITESTIQTSKVVYRWHRTA